MNGVKYASVWVEDIQQWVPLGQINIIQKYTHDGKSCAQFEFEGKVLESYIEYKELY